MAKENIHQISHHPTRVRRQIRALAGDLSRVDYSVNLNDLVQARKVSMSAVWACLEDGEIVAGTVHHESNGIYAKLRDVIAGVQIDLDLLLEPVGEDNRLVILWAEELEEE